MPREREPHSGPPLGCGVSAQATLGTQAAAGGTTEVRGVPWGQLRPARVCERGVSASMEWGGLGGWRAQVLGALGGIQGLPPGRERV